jgi:hypothetical protein
MWLAQTYLRSPSEGFPFYAYFFFNPYVTGRENETKELMDILAILGEHTWGRLAIVAPANAQDFRRIGKELDRYFRPLIDRLRQNIQDLNYGLFFSDRSLEDIINNNIAYDWIYYELSRLGASQRNRFFQLIEKIISKYKNILHLRDGIIVHDNRERIKQALISLFEGLNLPGAARELRRQNMDSSIEFVT